MGGFFSGAAARGCRVAITSFTAAISAAALALPFAGAASAAPAATLVHAPGITAPAGVVVTPDGETWISDALYGLCRVTPDGPAMIEFCAPEAEEPATPPVPEGTPEPVPPTPTAPTGTGQIAFDEATSNFYVAEGTSGGGGVWRMHWDAATGEIDRATKIFETTGITRVTGLALTATGDVVFSDKETLAIRRLSNPATIESTSATVTTTVGFAAQAGPSSLAVLGNVVYLAEGGSVTKLDPSVLSATAAPVPGEPAGAGVSALAADPARGVVYAGTSTPKLTDAVLSIENGRFSVAAYDRGFANVTGLGVGPAGALFIAHDPNSALSPGVDTSGLAELYRKDAGPLVAPEAKLLTHPHAVTQSGRPTFTFDAVNGTEDTHFECTLDGDAVACPVTGIARGAYAQPEGQELGEGRHTFTVRAANVPEAAATDWGPTASFAFRVDRTAPVVTIDAPSSHTAEGSVRLFFSADEAGASFTCQDDHHAAFDCNPPRDFALDPGEHAITVRATDDAGNASDPVTWAVTAREPAPVTAPAPAARPSAQPAPAAPATAPIAVDALDRVPRLEIGTACVEVSAARAAAASLRLAGRAALVRFRAPGEARYAKFTLRRATRKRSAATIVEALAYARVARAGVTHATRIVLTRSQARLVRSGRMRVSIAYGTCRTQLGQWAWVTTSSTTQEGNR